MMNQLHRIIKYYLVFTIGASLISRLLVENRYISSDNIIILGLFYNDMLIVPISWLSMLLFLYIFLFNKNYRNFVFFLQHTIFYAMVYYLMRYGIFCYLFD